MPGLQANEDQELHNDEAEVREFLRQRGLLKEPDSADKTSGRQTMADLHSRYGAGLPPPPTHSTWDESEGWDEVTNHWLNRVGPILSMRKRAAEGKTSKV